MKRLFILVSLLSATLQVDPHVISLSDTQLTADVDADFTKDNNDNLYEINLGDSSILMDKHLFILVESENPNFVLSILDADRSHKKRDSVLIDVNTFTGNIALVMSDTFFNSQLEFFKESTKLRFMVTNKPATGNMSYKVRVQIGKKGTFQFGRVYTTRVDYMISDLPVDLVYDGTNYQDVQKLRFQLTAVKTKSDYALSSSLQYRGDSYLLNPVFKKAVGGVLTSPKLPICKSADCVYTLKIHLEKVKVLNIESYLVEDMERLSINHYDDYYDRVYDNNVTTKYELVYDPAMAGMDVSVCLIPVTGTSGLYVNPVTVPTDLNKYAWKELGQLAKRITIKWDELVQMRAQGSNLIIAVHSDKPGEYLLRIDAHEPGFKGRLTSGIIEAGFVKEKEINNYLYQFEVYETQDISFNVKMVIFSGEANIYLMKCEKFQECKITEEDIAGGKLMAVENNHSTKTIKHAFKCEQKRRAQTSICQFAVAVKGSESHGAHFDISLQEDKFHRLMVPGHAMNLNLNAEEIVHLKFSYPKVQSGTKLFLSIEPIWGSFSIALSKKEEFPAINGGGKFREEFSTARVGLYNSAKMIPITTKIVDDYTIQGLYFIGVTAVSSCALNIKFFEKADNELTLHTMTAGNQSRGETSSATEIVYYTIKLSLSDAQANSISVNLTPLKGSFTLFANKNGKLPSADNHEFVSDSHHLELSFKDINSSSEECIVGVQLNSKIGAEGERYQFLISFSYSSKPQLLHPGLLTTHTVKEANYFLIEVTREMSDLLVIKTIVDGFNINLCGKFASSESIEAHESCDFSAEERKVGFYLTEPEIKKHCGERWGSGKCFLQLSVKGNVNQKYSVGYTYNDHPFQLIKDLAVHGPIVSKGNFSINYIHHIEPEQPIGIYFNAKGRDLNIFTKLVDGDEFNDKLAIAFPHASNHDSERVSKVGHVTNVYYDAATVAKFGKSPELLISVRTSTTSDAAAPFDFNHAFLVQSSLEGREILRTQTHTQMVQEEEWNYYTFYNNGNSGSLRIFVSSQVATKLELGLSRNKKSRPPFTNKALVSKSGVGSVELEVTAKDLKSHDSKAAQDGLKGFYTLAVKSSLNCFVNIFWNNKEDLDYFEVTPGEPSTMVVNTRRKLYFSTYVTDVNSSEASERANIAFYVKSSVKADLYILKSHSGDLDAPSSNNYTWKTSISKAGGVSVLNVLPTDPEYCIDCTYIGLVDASDDGQAVLLVDVEHQDIPIFLQPGLNFPFHVEGDEQKLYRVHNPDSGIMGVTLSLLSGRANMYVSASADVSETSYKDFYPLETGLDNHKFITINPFDYDITAAHDFYILVSCNKNAPASFVLSVSKNKDHSSIETGVAKYVNLAPRESTEFYYKPKKGERSFEVRLKLRQILDERSKEEALKNVHEYMAVHVVASNGDKHAIKYKTKDAHKKTVHMEFDVPENSDNTFSIGVKNPLKSAITLTVELTQAGYKLVHLNEYSVEQLRGTEPVIYEAHGVQDKYLFVDLRMCLGDVKLSFYQSDFDNVGKDQSVEYKTIKDANTFMHSVKMEAKKVFLKVENVGTENSIYELSLFSETDLDHSPYNEVAQGDGGKIDVETDNHVLRVPPIKLKSNFMEGFQHKISYKVYITDSFKIMRYLKNCGLNMINRAFPNPHVLSFSKVESFSSEKLYDARGKIEIRYSGLNANTKYYGVVVASVDLFPLDGGYVTAVRSAKVYYDEFVIMTPRMSLPINLILGLVVSAGLLACLFWVVRSYLFGEINKMHGLEKLTNFEDLDSGVLGPNLVSILEQEYYEGQDTRQISRRNTGESSLDEEPTEDDAPDLFEMTDRNERKRPLA